MMRLWRSPGEILTVLAANKWTKIWGPTHQLPGWPPEWKRHWLLPQRQSQWPAYEEYIEAWTIPQISMGKCNVNIWCPLRKSHDIMKAGWSHSSRVIICLGYPMVLTPKTSSASQALKPSQRATCTKQIQAIHCFNLTSCLLKLF